MKRTISILLINPWIFDFAAYNLWVEPLGLEYIASILKLSGAQVTGIDCLHSKYNKNPKQKKNGCSKFIRKVIEKPSSLKFVKRYYSRYGISSDEFKKRLEEAEQPDIILITSIMTYWYPGIIYTISILREIYGNRIPIILGGIYANLCKKHAESFSGADFVYSDRSPFDLIRLIEKITGKKLHKSNLPHEFNDWPYPDHTLFREGFENFFTILTQQGCPFRCSYCASPILNKGIDRRDKESVINEIISYNKILKTNNIAFYDDALLLNPKDHILPILEEILKQNIPFNFHLPNAIHSRFISKKIAKLFIQTGFKTIRIGLETSNITLQKKSGGKISNEEYLRSIKILRNAGYEKRDLGVYILVGLPDQHPEDVEETIKFVDKSGSSPYLSFFSPIPGTSIFNEAAKITSLDIKNEPIFQNNSVFILKHPNFSEDSIQYLKDMAREIRRFENNKKNPNSKI